MGGWARGVYNRIMWNGFKWYSWTSAKSIAVGFVSISFNKETLTHCKTMRNVVYCIENIRSDLGGNFFSMLIVRKPDQNHALEMWLTLQIKCPKIQLDINPILKSPIFVIYTYAIINKRGHVICDLLQHSKYWEYLKSAFHILLTFEIL